MEEHGEGFSPRSIFSFYLIDAKMGEWEALAPLLPLRTFRTCSALDEKHVSTWFSAPMEPRR